MTSIEDAVTNFCDAVSNPESTNALRAFELLQIQYLAFLDDNYSKIEELTSRQIVLRLFSANGRSKAFEKAFTLYLSEVGTDTKALKKLAECAYHYRLMTPLAGGFDPAKDLRRFVEDEFGDDYAERFFAYLARSNIKV